MKSMTSRSRLIKDQWCSLNTQIEHLTLGNITCEEIKTQIISHLKSSGEVMSIKGLHYKRFAHALNKALNH